MFNDNRPIVCIKSHENRNKYFAKNKARKTINPTFSLAYQDDNFTTLMIKFNRKTLKFYKEKPIYTLDENDFLG